MMNVSERRVVFLVGAVQFVNVLDFTMVMPLGPDFARALHIPMSELGKIVAGYGQAAAVAGLAGSFFLDRFDRRKALAVAMLGLVCGTLAGGLARGVGGLTFARVIAGAFGGPATSLSYAIIADVIPPERRGKATGAVMAAFSVAQVLGVPAALIVSGRFGWRMPFYAVAVLGGLVVLAAVFLLPSLTAHRERTQAVASFRDLLARPTVRLSYTMTATLMTAGFLLIPNLPAYAQANLGYPRDRYQYLLIVAGVASFITLHLFGRLTDRIGSFRAGSLGALGSVVVMWFFFVRPPSPAPVMLLYVAFTIAFGARNVAYNALTTRVPRPHERARFLSLQSTIYHATSSAASWASSASLRTGDGGRLEGMARLALVAMALSALLPLLLWLVEARVTRASSTSAA